MKYLPQHCLKSYILVTYIMRQKQVKKLLKFFVIVCSTTGKQNKTASLIYLSFYLTKLTQFIRLSSLLLTLSGFSYDCEGRTLRRLNPLGFTAACHIQWNPALRPPRLSDHLVITAIFFQTKSKKH